MQSVNIFSFLRWRICLHSWLELSDHLLTWLEFNLRIILDFFLFSFGIKIKNNLQYEYTVKLGNKERFDKEQIGIKELFMDYQPFYTINLLLDKEFSPI